jgi:kynurenine formamidase
LVATSTTGVISAQEFDAIFESIKNWGRWGKDDDRGALNFITAEKRRTAAALVREGRVVSCTVPLPSSPAIDNPRPVVHLMVRSSDSAPRDSLAGGSADYFATEVHGFNRTHIDAFCHFSYKGNLYNGLDAGLITSAGAGACTIVPASEGIVSRGVLLDIPRLKGVDWIELGIPIMTEDLEAAERAAGVTVQQGDILLVRTGYKTRRATLGPLPWQDRSKPGLHAETLRWLHQREIAVLGGDGDSDMTPSSVVGGGLSKPIHVGTLVAMGVHLLDNCELDDLARTCSELNRWEFQLTVAPLRLESGTGSPVNPLAIF